MKYFRYINVIYTAIVVSIVSILYLIPVHVHKDYDSEAMIPAMVNGWLLIAKEQGVGLAEFLKKSPLLDDYKREDVVYSYATPRKRLGFENNALGTPLVNICYYPFVRIFGVEPRTIAYYSTGWMLINLLLIYFMTKRYYGTPIAFISILCLSLNLTWLIHVKAAGMQWMPSLMLLLLLIWCLIIYFKSHTFWSIPLCGVILGLLYTSSWISMAFGLAYTFSILALNVMKLKWRTVRDGLVICVIAFFTAESLMLFYSWYGGMSFADVNLCVWDIYTDRLKQGYAPTQTFGVAAKVLYAVKCLFIDMTQCDHLDKCLEGHPAVTLSIWLLMASGIVHVVRRRSEQDKALLLYAGVTMAMFFTIYLYSNRYFIMILPIFCIFGAIGAEYFVKKAMLLGRSYMIAVVLIIAAMMTWEFKNTYTAYYEEYMIHKKPNFEIDRMRGHEQFAEWLKKNFNSDDTMVVLNDQVMFTSVCFMFNTFNAGFRFNYWVNYINANTSVDNYLKWEADLMNKYKKVVFAFSTLMLESPKGGYQNDWSVFLKAHPGVQPVYAYSFAERPPSFYVFVVEKQ